MDKGQQQQQDVGVCVPADDKTQSVCSREDGTHTGAKSVTQ